MFPCWETMMLVERVSVLTGTIHPLKTEITICKYWDLM